MTIEIVSQPSVRDQQGAREVLVELVSLLGRLEAQSTLWVHGFHAMAGLEKSLQFALLVQHAELLTEARELADVLDNTE